MIVETYEENGLTGILVVGSMGLSFGNQTIAAIPIMATADKTIPGSNEIETVDAAMSSSSGSIAPQHTSLGNTSGISVQIPKSAIEGYES